ncbi:hypothetical protein COCVIDRAFT_32298 [Bipolaris victoriae FI3]|uniref:Hydrophobin n=1 Tax=Bipolaris victoriae (strain FI3) TaxID=930091 RepID=W7E8K9_BIPV3|nr:hypothetical protein COCVIDRAFT_32298 [Bipolaris victoriae FI3]
MVKSMLISTVWVITHLTFASASHCAYWCGLSSNPADVHLPLTQSCCGRNTQGQLNAFDECLVLNPPNNFAHCCQGSGKDICYDIDAENSACGLAGIPATCHNP